MVILVKPLVMAIWPIYGQKGQPMHTLTSKDKKSIRQELLRVVACRAARLRLTKIGSKTR